MIYVSLSTIPQRLKHLNESIKSFIPQKASLEQDLEELESDTEGDREEALKAISLGGTQTKFDEVTEQANLITAEVETKQQEYTSLTANLIDKSDTSTAEAQLLSSISQLAARTGIELVETTPVTSFSNTNLLSKKNNSITTDSLHTDLLHTDLLFLRLPTPLVHFVPYKLAF